MCKIFNKLCFIILISLSINLFAQDYQFIEVSDNINGVQPMTGIILWTDNEYNSTDAIALEYSYMLYSDVVSQQGIYNWTVVDDLLENVASRNHQVVLRFRFVYPGYQTAVPQYIKDLEDYEETKGQSEGLTTYFPDWTHSELKRFTLEFYEKFAERYDNDRRLAYVQTGFGLWAEYHIYDGPFILGETFPDKAFQEEFFYHLDDVFENKTWSISIDAADEEYTPFESKPSLKNIQFGLFDDSFMHEEHDDYNEWCWDFFNRERYLTSPAGGEFSYYSDYDQEHVLDLEGPYGIPFETFVENFHMTYIIGSDQPEYQTMQRIKEASMCMGYKFKVCSFKTTSGSSIVKVVNVGVAPLYCDAYIAVNGVRSQTSLKLLAPGDTLTSLVEAGGSNPVLTIESDNILTSQVIGYLGNEGEIIPEEPTQFTLTTSVIGEGTIEPSSGVYDSATVITLSAVPADGWQFTGWSGEAYGTSNPLSVTMNSNQAITATFTEIISTEYTLNASITGSGSIILNPEGGNYVDGTVVEITAIPDEDWQFDAWNSAASGIDNPLYITMNSDKDLQVFFSEITKIPQYSLSVTTYGQGEVSIDPEMDRYDEGTVVNLTARPANGWIFSGWSGDNAGADNPCQITMNSDMDIIAEYTQSPEPEGFQFYKFTCTATNNSRMFVRSIDLLDENTSYNLSERWYVTDMSAAATKTLNIGTAINTDAIRITPGRTVNLAPRDFKVEGSNDNENWTLLLEQTDIQSSTWTANSATTFSFNEGELYIYALKNNESLSANQFLLYPNPTNGMVNIQIEKMPEVITILNMMGQVVLIEKQTKGTFDISHLENGIYFVLVNGEKIRLIKQ